MSPGRSTTSEPQSVRVTRGGDEVSREIRETRVKGGGRTRGKRSRDLTSAVVRHARGARVLVIHVTPVHDASRRRVSAIRSSRGCANDVVADAASGSISRRRRKKIAKTSFSSKLRVLAVVRDEARHSRRARGDARAGWLRIKPRLSPGRRRRSPATILDGSGYARASSLVSASRSLARFQGNHPLTSFFSSLRRRRWRAGCGIDRRTRCRTRLTGRHGALCASVF